MPAGNDMTPHTTQGSLCPDAYVEAAKRTAGGLTRYEGAAALSGVVKQGAEPRAVRDALSLPDGFQAQENRAYDADYRVRRKQSLLLSQFSVCSLTPIQEPRQRPRTLVSQSGRVCGVTQILVVW